MTLEAIRDIKETGARTTREYKTQEPPYIKKLYGSTGNQDDVGRLIGVTGSAINGYLKSNQATTAMELAAQFVWERDYAAKPASETKAVAAIIQGELHHIRTVKDMIETLGGKFTFLEL